MVLLSPQNPEHYSPWSQRIIPTAWTTWWYLHVSVRLWTNDAITAGSRDLEQTMCLAKNETGNHPRNLMWNPSLVFLCTINILYKFYKFEKPDWLLQPQISLILKEYCKHEPLTFIFLWKEPPYFSRGNESVLCLHMDQHDKILLQNQGPAKGYWALAIPKRASWSAGNQKAFSWENWFANSYLMFRL